MELSIVNNAAMNTFLARFRDRNSSHYECITFVETLSFFLAGEASNYLEQKEIIVQTPLGQKKCKILSEPVLLVPVLRAGLSMLTGFQRIIDDYDVGFIWAHRDNFGKSHIDNNKLPNKFIGKTAIILDTMLATGGTINACTELLKIAGIEHVWAASIFSTQYGIDHLSSQIEHLFSVDISDVLDAQLYINPGVGDSGDRLFG